MNTLHRSEAQARAFVAQMSRSVPASASSILALQKRINTQFGHHSILGDSKPAVRKGM